MKKFFRSTIAMALLATLVLGTTVSASAATNDTTCVESTVETAVDTNATARIASYNINTSWTTVLSSSSGFNRDVYIQATTFTYNGLVTTVPCDIRMLDKNGNVLWTGTGSVPGQNQKVSFWCGSDVYKVQIRTQAGNGIVYAW